MEKSHGETISRGNFSFANRKLERFLGLLLLGEKVKKKKKKSPVTPAIY